MRYLAKCELGWPYSGYVLAVVIAATAVVAAT